MTRPDESNKPALTRQLVVCFFFYGRRPGRSMDNVGRETLQNVHQSAYASRSWWQRISRNIRHRLPRRTTQAIVQIVVPSRDSRPGYDLALAFAGTPPRYLLIRVINWLFIQIPSARRGSRLSFLVLLFPSQLRSTLITVL